MRQALRPAVCLAAALGIYGAAAAQVCDPPGPPPRFGCAWSTETCEWVCAVCDPFGVPPRSNCTWDQQVCNWICPGYTGVDVTVHTTHAPMRDATVYVKLSSLCRQTGAVATCGGSFAVSAALSIPQKCEAIAQTVAGNCGPAGYSVTADDCALTGSFTATNVGCPGTQFALGVSNDPGDFDQADQPALPDGESELTEGWCQPMPGTVAGLRVEKVSGGSSIRLTWNPVANADDYTAFDDPASAGSFDAPVGTTADPASGLTVAMPQGTEFYLVAGSNTTCGAGPKD